MKLLFLTHHFQTPDQPGASRPWQIAKFLAERGHDVVVITAGVHYMTGELADSVRKHLWVKDKDEKNLLVIKTYALPQYRASLKRRIASYLIYSFLAFCAGLRQNKFDLVLVATTPLSVTFSGYLLAKLKRAQFVIEERELFPEEAVELGHIKSRILIRFLEAYQQFFRAKAKKIIALTPGIKRALVEKGIDDHKIVVITNACYIDVHSACDREGVRLALGWHSKFVVLYAGGFGQVSELWTLLRAAQKLLHKKDILFVLIGEGEKKEKYKEFCIKNNLTNCCFVSAQPQKKMTAFYKGADVCVHLLPKGDFWRCVLANKIFDYLGSGCPVIFAGAGDTADLLMRAKAGLVIEPENPDALARAILDLYSDPEKRKRMGKRGQDYILTQYRKEKIFKELEEVLLQTINSMGRKTKSTL